jgi:hypothetical protein
MKCIDAVEGTVKCILNQLHAAHMQVFCDDSEYIYQVKTVIDATGAYVEQNPELIQDPAILKQVLYTYSRNLWLKEKLSGEASQNAPPNGSTSETDDYQTYYYDYVYERGVYPN